MRFTDEHDAFRRPVRVGLQIEQLGLPLHG